MRAATPHHRRFCIAAALTALLLLSPGTLLAGPASPDTHTLRQADGTSFEARQWGDEWMSGWETLDGYSVVLDPLDATWKYATRQPDGSLAASSVAVGPAGPGAVLEPHLRPDAHSWEQARAAAGPAEATEPREVVPPTGTANVPVILVNFSDTSPTHTPSEFTSLLFGSNTWSMRDYFTQVSYGKFTVAAGPSGVAGWYTASKTHDYYGEDQDTTKDYWFADLIYEAVQAADQAGFNFSPYDLDGDCFVDVVNVVHQGTGQDSSGVVSDIWSKSWNLYSANYYGRSHYPQYYTTNDTCVAGGYVKVNAFVIQPEVYDAGLTTMGVFAHEFGHALGLPDLYDTDDSSEGVGKWSLMASGSWCKVARSGDRPAHMDPWSKIKLGWVTPHLVSGTLQNQSITQASSAASVYQLLAGSPTAGGEYFLVENRELSSFDAGLPGAGLLIWHVDESQTSNQNECYPGGPSCASQHYKVALVQADDSWDLEKHTNRGDEADPFPGWNNNRSFTDSSSPSSSLYSGISSGVSVSGISDAGSTMTATLTAQSGKTLTVTKGGTGSGTVSSSPAGINCGATCSASFASGASVTLTATPSGGSTFTGWSGSCTGTGACTVVMSQNRAVTATFTTGGGGETTIFSDGFEGGWPGQWQFFVASTCDTGGTVPCANTNWGRVSCQKQAGTYSAWCAAGGSSPQTGCTTYVPYMKGWMFYGPFSLADATDAWAEFDVRLTVETDYDSLAWMISTNGQNYSGFRRSTNTTGWEHVRFNFKDVTAVTAVGASSVYIAFIFTADSSSQYEGAYVDNLVIKKATASPSCTYAINPTSASPGASATTGTVSVTASPSSCAWTAASNSSFLTVNTGASGLGNGSVGYSVAANTGAARTGTLTIAGKTFTVNQAGGSSVPCTYSYWVPVAARQAGSGGSNWRSDLGLLNTGTSGASIEVRAFTGTSTLRRSMTLAGGATDIVRDLLDWLSSGFTGTASIQVCAGQPLQVMSRTYNLEATGKTFGQGYDGLTAADTLSAGQTAVLPMLTQNGIAGTNGTYRTNIGIVNTGTGTASVTVTLYDATGTQVWSNTRSYAAGEKYQYNEPFKAAGRNNIDKGYARVRVESGNGVFAYASVLDNGSSDPTTINMKK